VRSDANRIAFGAAKQILASARPLNLDVAGTHVTCTVTQRAAPAWPTDELANLDASRDGPWPSPVEVECRWDDGTATLRVSVERWNRGSYRGLVGLRVRLLPRNRSLLWSTLPKVIGDAEDGTVVPVPGWCTIVKRRRPGSEILQRTLKKIVAATGLPLLSASRVQLFRVELPTGAVVPSPEAAFHHLVQLALLKLDFLDRGPRAAGRGRPLIDLKAVLPVGSEPPPPTEEDDEDDEEEDDPDGADAEPNPLARRLPLNLILFGPPGTGKTYHLLTEIAPLFTDDGRRPPRVLTPLRSKRSPSFRGGRWSRWPWTTWAGAPRSKAWSTIRG
jgi:hypothetical protein